MGNVIGSLLPLAIGVAVAPVPIIAVILMLLAPRAGGASVGFALGWVAGIIAVTVVALLAAGRLNQGPDDAPSTAGSWTRLILGVLLFAVGVRQWRSRPDAGEKAELPGWLSAIDRVTPAKAAGLGFILAAMNPKNLLICISAGVTIGGAGLDGSETTIAVTVFTLLATCTVALPVLAYAVAADRMRGGLEELKAWLEAHNAALIGGLLLVIGALQVGKGLGGLF